MSGSLLLRCEAGRLLRVIFAMGVFCCPLIFAQSISPGTGVPSRQSKEKPDQSSHVGQWFTLKVSDQDEKIREAAIEANKDCKDGQFTEVKAWFPVNYSGASDTRDGSSTNGITCFFGSTGPVTYISHTQFLYGFGESSSSVSADIASLQFDSGFQVSLGSTITGAAPKDTNPPSQNGQATPAQALAQIKNGGDFYLKGVWPVLYGVRRKASTSSPSLLGLIAFVPRLGFNIAGVSAQTTLTESTEYNWFIPVEAYGHYNALGDKGMFYGDVRTGYQWVQPEFAAKAGLGAKNAFLLTQISGGIQFNGFLRIGFEKFYGPAQAFSVEQNEFNKVHLVVQFAPSQLAKSKN